ncbi:MAG: NADH-quinone oxidoreductase subunit K [Chlamydiales bacterium]|nr:NADH-quinone oxidoreductase subunit K [Chlamydiia bacterium]MCP5508710.1 NADH-quinone oxidoreductase subunit K [Chlamydiales bacterium]
MISWDYSILVGVLFAVSAYLMLSKSYWNVLIGFVLLSNSVNLLILFSSMAPTDSAAPIINETGGGILADPLPQALILTSIVIGFGLCAYFASLLYALVARGRNG